MFTLIEAPTNLGLKQLTDAKPGVNKLPSYLKQHGLYEVLHPQEIVIAGATAYTTQLDEQSGVLNADAIVAYSQKLAKEITAALTTTPFAMVIGGDCSVLIGCALAMKSAGNYGLFFLDGHTDFVTPQFSTTKAAAGMDLAIVSGNGPEKLTDINSLKPYIAEENIFAIGNRCLDADYVKLIEDSNINYHDLYQLRETGIENIVEKFLAMVNENGLDGFWIHLDLDVLDNEVMPCVDSPQPGGLSYAELNLIFKLLLRSQKAKGVDITILDPDLDPNGVSTNKLINAFFTQISYTSAVFNT